MTWYRLIGAVVLSLTTSVATTSAQPPAPPPTTAVLVNLTIKPDVDRQQVMSIMPEEVRATLKLYLEGKIQQWYSRGDGRGVLFIMNSTSLADAKAIMDDMPLSKANVANYEFTALGPLMPLRALMTPGAGGAGKNDR